MPKASLLWDNFFIIHETEHNYAVCRLCSPEMVKMKFLFGDSVQLRLLREHLMKIHKISEAHLRNLDERVAQAQSILKLLTKQPGREEKMKKLAIAFCMNSLPRSLIENTWFQQASDIPENTRVEELEKHIAAVTNESLEKLKTSIKRNVCSCQIDNWEHGSRYITGITINDLLWKLEEFHGKETKENVIEITSKHFKAMEATCDTVIISISADNCTKVDIPIALVCRELGIIHTRCVSHSLSLSIKDVLSLPDFKDLLLKVNLISKIFKRKRHAREMLLSKQKAHFQQNPTTTSSSNFQQNLIKHTKPMLLKLPNQTRWLGQLECWERFVVLLSFVRDCLNELKIDPSFIDEYVNSNDYPNESNEDDDNDHDELQYVNMLKDFDEPILQISAREETKLSNFYVSCIRPLIVAVQEVQVSNFSLIELCYWWKQMIQKIIAVTKWDSSVLPWINNINLSPKLHPNAQSDIQHFWMEVGKTLDDRSNQFNDKIITIGEFLIPDPIGTKYSYLDDSTNVINWFFGRGETPEEGYQADCHWNVGPRLLKRINDVKNNLKPNADEQENQKKLKEITEVLHSELSTYELNISNWKLMTPSDKINDPLAFWVYHQSEKYFPHLALLAHYILRVNCTNADVERVFKDTKNLLPSERNRLGTDKLFEEAVIKKNYHAEAITEKVHDRIANALSRHQERVKYDNNEEDEMIRRLEEYYREKTKRKRKKIDEIDEDVNEALTANVPSKKMKIFKEISKNQTSIGPRRPNSKTSYDNRVANL